MLLGAGAQGQQAMAAVPIQGEILVSIESDFDTANVIPPEPAQPVEKQVLTAKFGTRV
jgi:hypothetical protein